MVRLRDLRSLQFTAAVMAAWFAGADDDSATEQTGAVCPFCGRGDDEPPLALHRLWRRPVVGRADRRVYDAVLAGCARVAGRK